MPLAQTLVLDTNNLAACWQDALMPDLPSAIDNAPAVYVSHDEDANLGGAGGAIFVIGGHEPPPGPSRLVFRYDLATSTWEQFQIPQLVVPEPATGRRNQAAVFVPAQAVKGSSKGVPGLWTFGGNIGFTAQIMTNTSEYYAIINNP